MVDSRIQLRSLSTGELTGIINIYPWFGGARKELCRRMAREGGATEEQFAEMALHIPAREKIYRLLREPALPSASFRKTAPAAEEKPRTVQPKPEPQSQNKPSVRIAGGDYFSASEYEQVSSGGDSLLTGLHFKARKETSDEKPSKDITEIFQTEALAEIFADQGYPDIAKRIYSKLILVYPEKSAYFASLIEKLD